MSRLQKQVSSCTGLCAKMGKRSQFLVKYFLRSEVNKFTHLFLIDRPVKAICIRKQDMKYSLHANVTFVCLALNIYLPFALQTLLEFLKITL